MQSAIGQPQGPPDRQRSKLRWAKLSSRLQHRPHATGAYANRLQLSIDLQSLAMDIRAKITVCPPLRVTDVVAKTFGFPTNFT